MKRQIFFMSLFAFAFVLSLTSTAMAELALSVIVNPNPVRPGETAHVEYTVTNNGATTETNVILNALIPSNVDPFPQTLNTGLGGGGTCQNPSCLPTEQVTWNMKISPGESVTVTMSPRITGTTADGTVIEFSGTIEQGGNVIPPPASVTTVVKSNTVLELSLMEDLDPIAPDGFLTYTLSFGNHSSATLSSDTSLSMPIPTGTTFFSATGGGIENAVGVVEWNIGGLIAGKSGRRQLKVRVDAGTSEGQILRGEARIADATSAHTAQALSVTRVESSMPLSLLIRVRPDPARAPESLNVVYTITNLSSSTLLGVKLHARIPEHVNAFDEALSNGGDCPNIVSVNLCSPREHLTWQNIGTLAVGASVDLTIPQVIMALTPKGTIIPFEAFIEADSRVRAYAATSVIIADQARIRVSALNTVFGNVEVGTSSDKVITITNDGNVGLDIATIASSNPVAAPFSIPSETDNCSNTRVVSAGNCTFTVRFSPTVKASFDDTFDIPSNDPAAPSVTISLNGSSFVPLIDIKVTDSVSPADDLQVAFGEVTVGGAADQIITVTNEGNLPLNIATVAFNDALKSPFTTQNDNCLNVTLAAAGSCTLSVRFSPTGIGPFSDTFDIPSNDPDENPVIVSVSGIGVIGNATPTAPALVFPGDGGTVAGLDVSFGWNRSSDSDGDTTIYTLRVCKNAILTEECITESNLAAIKNKGFNYAGLSLGFGLMFGFVIIGTAKGRKSLGVLLAILMVSGLLVSGCGSGSGDNVAGGGVSASDITKTITNLEANTTYHWKVTADDGKGGITDSVTRSFKTAG